MLTVFTNSTVELGPEVQNLANVATLENLQAKDVEDHRAKASTK